ncbi:MAG: ribosomal protein S18-alanine N-acetyltransferase [Elusimicrobiota bacterium]|jgi:ribosomal-protein-alanine acetyltransferase
MPIAIRRAQAADLDAVLAVESSWATTPHWTRRQFESELASPRSLFFVALDDLLLAGYAVAWTVDVELQVLDVAVRPELARRGTGRRLLDALYREGRAAGCLRATLEVSASNGPASALYASEGFVVVGRRPNYYNDRSDAILMDKPL